MNDNWKTRLGFVAIPVAYALVLRFFFGANGWEDVFNMMSTTFLFLLPSIVGALTVYFSSKEKAQRPIYAFFAPWIPVFIFFFITLFFAIEGWPCLIMILPIFLIAATIGGFIGRYIKFRKKNKNTYISLLVLLPVVASPLENYIGARTEP